MLSSILIVGKDARVELAARKFAAAIYAADTIDDAGELLDAHDPEAVVIDSAVPINHACSIADRAAPVPVVAMMESDDGDAAKAFRQAGGHAVISSDDTCLLSDILHSIKSGAKKGDAPLNDDNARTGAGEKHANPLVAMIGESPSMVNARRMIKVVAASRCNPILIVGETGTGKEIAAKSAHELRNPNAPFVAVNCAALTANLLESELFGHCKGSFTGADSEKTGLLELAGAGTIFLDEISEMPLELQAKLLRVLQEHKFRKVGGTQEIACKATIIASSNRNLRDEVKEKRFRRDLYYRLSICPISLQPLRCESRQDDIIPLAEHFLATSAICPEKSRTLKGFTSLAAEALLRHTWPGNVRELRNVIDRAVLLERGDRISLDSIILNPDDISRPEASRSAASDVADFSLQKAEQELIARALRETGWQKSRAASLLGITRATLYAKVKQYSIQPTPSSGELVEAGK